MPERGSERKVGCYVCKGCGLGERLDVDGLNRVAEIEAGADLVRDHAFLCSAEGVQGIQDDIDNKGVTHVCVAACSPRMKIDTFGFEGLEVVRISLREGVIRARPDAEEYRQSTQELAADYIRMGVMQARMAQETKAAQAQGRIASILVVGGGVSGMTAALEAARAGYRATVVEQSSVLGGALGAMKARIPDLSPYADPQATGVVAMIADVEVSASISVHLDSRVVHISGAPGRFAVDIVHDSGSSSRATFGAIVQATGFKAWDARRLGSDYIGNVDVVTQTELEALALAAGEAAIRRPSDGKEVASVVFVQCAGQRSEQAGHLSWCSGYCCLASIKQAMYFKDQNPRIDTTVLYTDLHTPGSQGEDFYRSAQKKGVVFVRGVVGAITPASDGPVVRFLDQTLGQAHGQTGDQAQELACDLVVLATGMEPNPGIPVVRGLEADMDSPEASALTPDAHSVTDTEGEASGVLSDVLVAEESSEELVRELAGESAGAGVARASGRVSLSFETRRAGIYSAGSVRRPMDAAQAMEDASGAAMKAIHALEDAAQGRCTGARAGALSLPRFRLDGCIRCRRCVIECPFEAIDEDANGYPVLSESACRRCGLCMGACPTQVVSFASDSVESLERQIQQVSMPPASAEQPRILVFACENSALPALDMAANEGIHWSAWARVVPVPCMGVVNSASISTALGCGYDGIVLMACNKEGACQCRFAKGSAFTEVRMDTIHQTLQRLGLEQGRVALDEIVFDDVQCAPRLINDMAQVLEGLAPNPRKAVRGEERV